MSEYTVCRKCGTNLEGGQRSFGAYECCCNDGWCMRCCPETVANRTDSPPKAPTKRRAIR